MGAWLLVGLLIARLGFHRDEGVTVATAALFVLTTGDTHDESALLVRFLATAIGVGIGVLVNVIVFPPLNHRSALRAGEWLAEPAAATAGDLRAAGAVLGRSRASRKRRGPGPEHGPAGARVDPVRSRVGSAVPRAVTGSAHVDRPRVWDPDAEVGSLRNQVNAITEDLSGEDLPGLLWPRVGCCEVHRFRCVSRCFCHTQRSHWIVAIPGALLSPRRQRMLDVVEVSQSAYGHGIAEVDIRHALGQRITG